MFVIKFNYSIRFFLMRVWSLFHYRSYGAFFLQKIDSIIPTVVLPTTEIIEPNIYGQVSQRSGQH